MSLKAGNTFILFLASLDLEEEGSDDILKVSLGTSEQEENADCISEVQETVMNITLASVYGVSLPNHAVPDARRRQRLCLQEAHHCVGCRRVNLVTEVVLHLVENLSKNQNIVLSPVLKNKNSPPQTVTLSLTDLSVHMAKETYFKLNMKIFVGCFMS